MNTTTTKPSISTAQLLAALNWRYATKKFDAAKKIPADTWAALERSLVLAPSSMGLQPWKFIIITDSALKKKLSAASHGQTQPADASHLVVFALRKNLDAAFVEKYMERIAKVRGVTRDSLAGFQQMVSGGIGRYAQRDDGAGTADCFASQQCHIALGQFMTAAALLAVDTCALGGIDSVQYDELLKLKGTGYTTVIACAAGYRAGDDKYATLPKVRFEDKDVLAHI